MNKQYVAIMVVVLALAGVAWYVSTRETTDQAQVQSESLGKYAYTCGEGGGFMLDIASDMRSIRITDSSVGGIASEVELTYVEVESGVRYEGGGLVFTAKGETVQLVNGSTTITCSPKPNPDEAPFNFGD